ncbi:MAG TPA: hypothetical protein VEL51_03475 [Vicinamibacterales bacterium]|nr:hypothetical protein [Vicinamibacterales bacterium]
MEIVVHRVNTIDALGQIPREFGVEIDLRAHGSRIVLSHEPFSSGDDFDRWLDGFGHGLLVLNVKEAGIEAEVLARVRARGVSRCFLLDVEFPYLYRASRAGERAIAVRYSEDEPIEFVERYRTRVDWVWIDTLTRLPLDESAVAALGDLKSCLVCPERWGRPNDIPAYQSQMSALGFTPTAVMTALPYVSQWRAWSRIRG